MVIGGFDVRTDTTCTSFKDGACCRIIIDGLKFLKNNNGVVLEIFIKRLVVHDQKISGYIDYLCLNMNFFFVFFFKPFLRPRSEYFQAACHHFLVPATEVPETVQLVSRMELLAISSMS